MKEVRAAIVSVLDQVTLAQLCERARKLEGQTDTSVEYMI
jgi:DNA-binding IscR family transcriptional regulator